MVAFLIARVDVGKEVDVAKDLAKIDQVSEVYLITGEYDLLAKIEAAPQEVIDIVTEELRKITGVVETRTIFAKEIE